MRAMRLKEGLLLLCALAMGACATVAPEPVMVPVEEPPAPRPVKVTPQEEVPLRAMLAYYASNARSPAPLPREKPLPADPYLQLQQAIQLGQARPAELPRALNLLEMLMRSSHPAAVNLVPLARVLHEQYGERLRLEQQLREAQRRGEQLQEKIDALSAIERSLPSRSTNTMNKPVPSGTQENPR